MPTTIVIVTIAIVGVLAVILLVRRAAESRREREAQREVLRLEQQKQALAYLELLNLATSELDAYPEYISATWVKRWQAQHASILKGSIDFCRNPIAAECRQLEQKLADARNIDPRVKAHNDSFVERRIMEEQQRFDTIEKYPLEQQQRRAIVTNEDTTLVVAGAGTGKTSTIIGRTDYLLRRGLARPENVLVLAFNRSAAEELRTRLDELGVSESLAIRTFHALGLRIVGESQGVSPILSKMEEDPRERLLFFRKVLKEMLSDQKAIQDLLTYLTVPVEFAIDGDGSSNASRQIQFEKAQGLRSIDGRKMNSREEVYIANWLTLNGITWAYEDPYPFAVQPPWKRAYKPDFHLLGADIYLEHFGVDRAGRTAPQINTTRYVEAMAWKRATHAAMGTSLIETYSWMNSEGVLFTELASRLAMYGVYPSPLTEEQIAEIVKDGNQTFGEFLDLLNVFRSLYQGSGADRRSVEANATSERDRAFLRVFWRVYDAYRAELKQTGTIDFDDMINMARGFVQSGAYKSLYSHVIVDEFQDISENRLGLVTDLLSQHDEAHLFVVGDDWQSIYRFAGSDVGILTDLSSRVGKVQRVDLTVAYRYPQEILDVSSTFVEKNPAQLHKTLTSQRGHARRQLVTLMYDQSSWDSTPSPALSELSEDLIKKRKGTETSVLVLGRYRYEESTVKPFMQKLERAGMDARFLTVHRAKGQQADIVVVVGLKAGERGFPSEIEDDPVLHMVLSPSEAYRHAEERRLFYVALTRAKEQVFLIAPFDSESCFLTEDLLSDELRGYVQIIGAPRPRSLCPRCNGLTIVKKNSLTGGEFWACENYPACHGRLDECPECHSGVLEIRCNSDGTEAFVCSNCGKQKESCPVCGEGFIQPKNGRYGEFWGCSMFARGGCGYTRNSPVTTQPRLCRDRRLASGTSQKSRL